MSHTKQLYGPQAAISFGLATLLFVICSCSGGLLYIEDKTFTDKYFEGDVVYTVTASKFIICVSICVKECMQPCSLISFTDGTCRCHTSYAHNINGQFASKRDETMYFRIADTNDVVQETIQQTPDVSGVIPTTDVLTSSAGSECTGISMGDCNGISQEIIKQPSEISGVIPTTAILTTGTLSDCTSNALGDCSGGEKETTDVTTATNPSIFETASVKQEESEDSSIMGIVCSNTPSTVDSCEIVSDGEYYLKVFNTPLEVTFFRTYRWVYLHSKVGSKFHFEHQADGSYMINAKNNITTKYSLNVEGSYVAVKLSDSSSPVNQTYYFLEYHHEGSFKIRVKSSGHYLVKVGGYLGIRNKTYGDDGKFLIETTSPVWDVIFQIPTGSPYNIYQAFLHGKEELMTNFCEVNTNGTYKYSFTRKDSIIRDWWNECLSICKIRYSLIKNNQERLFFVFDGVNTSPESWFVAEKLQMCNTYQTITNLSLTADESGVWYFKITDKQLQMNITVAQYENLTDPSSPDRNLIIFLSGDSEIADEIRISVTTKDGNG